MESRNYSLLVGLDSLIIFRFFKFKSIGFEKTKFKFINYEKNEIQIQTHEEFASGFKFKFIDIKKTKFEFKFMKNSRADSNSLRCESLNFNFTDFERTNAKFKFIVANLTTFKFEKLDNLDLISRYLTYQTIK